MSKKALLQLVSFDNETNNLKQAQKTLKAHVLKMKARYNDNHNTYGIYMLVEKSK